jgi:hypothetical protein
MGEQSALAIGHPFFGSADPGPAALQNAFRPGGAGVRRNWPHRRNLEFEGSLADTFFQRR